MLAVQHRPDAAVVHLTRFGVTQMADVFKNPARLRLLDQQRDGERRVIKMPAQLLAGVRVVQIDRRQAVGIGEQLLLIQYTAEKRFKGGRIVQGAQGRVGGDLFIGNTAFR